MFIQGLVVLTFVILNTGRTFPLFHEGPATNTLKISTCYPCKMHRTFISVTIISNASV
jgi:hypothetical protein